MTVRAVMALTLLALAACASVPAFRTLGEADFRQLRPGMSTGEVEGLVGSPVLRLPLARIGEEVWDYRYFDAVTPMIARLHFELGGGLKRFEQMQDRDYYHGGTER